MGEAGNRVLPNRSGGAAVLQDENRLDTGCTTRPIHVTQLNFMLKKWLTQGILHCVALTFVNWKKKVIPAVFRPQNFWDTGRGIPPSLIVGFSWLSRKIKVWRGDTGSRGSWEEVVLAEDTGSLDPRAAHRLCPRSPGSLLCTVPVRAANSVTVGGRIHSKWVISPSLETREKGATGSHQQPPLYLPPLSLTSEWSGVRQLLMPFEM